MILAIALTGCLGFVGLLWWVRRDNTRFAAGTDQKTISERERFNEALRAMKP
jgi:hypothetical protein